jgi:hypothetical protein
MSKICTLVNFAMSSSVCDCRASSAFLVLSAVILNYLLELYLISLLRLFFFLLRLLISFTVIIINIIIKIIIILNIIININITIIIVIVIYTILDHVT